MRFKEREGVFVSNCANFQLSVMICWTMRFLSARGLSRKVPSCKPEDCHWDAYVMQGR